MPFFTRQSKLLAFDLELTRENGFISMGLTFEGHDTVVRKNSGEALALLARLCSKADFVVGHNILDHDLKWIATHSPSHPILTKPCIDTLYLSVLAFARNPYHALVKDYKLVCDTVNDPVRDSKLSLRLLED